MTRPLEIIVPSGWNGPAAALEEPACGVVEGDVESGLRRAVERGHDALLLDSATVLFPGAIAAMARAATLDPMIGFVGPRCNRGAVSSLPHRVAQPDAGPQESYLDFRRLSPLLPEFHFVPTAPGSCLLIRHEILEEFGLPGPSAAGLVEHANRCGYRVALANRAFVYHTAESDACGTPDRYFDSPHYRAERMLTALVPDSGGRRDIVFDFSTMGPYHNGTIMAGIAILRRAATLWRGFFRIHVMASQPARTFHQLDAIPGISFVEPDTRRVFALAFRFGQPFGFEQTARMNRTGVVNVYAMLDPIALDCLHLNDAGLELLWASVFGHADAVVYISDFAAAQFQRRFRRHARLREAVVPLSLDLRDYAPARAQEAPGEYILVAGNAFAHKYVAPTVEALRQALPEQRVVALGAGIESGQLSSAEMESLLCGARVVVFPSHYEGFGLPVIEGLAHRKPVFARDMPAMRELYGRLGAPANLVLYRSTGDLVARLEAGLPAWTNPVMEDARAADGWEAATCRLGALFREQLENVSFDEVLVPRLEHFELVNFYAGMDRDGLASPAPAGETRDHLKRLGRVLEDREAQIAAMRRSLSWRITGPLRAFADICLKMAGR